MAEQYFEMLWDCPQCATAELLGTTHRHCPTCGAAQDPARRYFPKPGTEVEASGHRFVGADWTCTYCTSPNSAAAAFCGNCGGPKDGAKTVAIVQDNAPTPVPSAPVQSAVSPRAKFSWATFVVGMGVLACVILAFLFFSKHDESVQLVEKTWSRSVDVEQFSAARSSDWCDAMPPDAYQVSRSREQRSTRQVAAGQDCVDVRSDMGDGTFTKRRECTPRYRNEPVFDTKCSYFTNRWRLLRTDRLAGAANLAPTWPSPLLANTLLPANSLGAQRLGSRQENYRITVQWKQGKSWHCDLSPDVWSGMAEKQTLQLKVRGIGGADCASLKIQP